MAITRPLSFACHVTAASERRAVCSHVLVKISETLATSELLLILDECPPPAPVYSFPAPKLIKATPSAVKSHAPLPWSRSPVCCSLCLPLSTFVYDILRLNYSRRFLEVQPDITVVSW